MKLKALVGSGDKIGLFTLPYLIPILFLNILFPEIFSVGGPSPLLKIISIIVLIPGLINWAWSVYLILTKIPKKELITTGPYSIVKHPLYIGVSLLVLPWAGFLLNTWLGLLIGIVMYIGSGKYAPDEEKYLSGKFGGEWDEYVKKVKFPGILKKHALLSYFVLAFAVSWGLIAATVGPDIINPWAEASPGILPLVVVIMLLGPIVSGLLMTALVDGKKGFSDLSQRIFKRKLKIRWYAALLIAPLSLILSNLVLSLFSPKYLLTAFSGGEGEVTLSFTFIGALLGGLMEEVGWTGFAIPRMLRRFNIFKTGLLLGLIWGAWHFIVNFWGSGIAAEKVPVAVFVGVALFSFLLPYRIIMVWLYIRTESLLLAILMHTSLIFFWLMFMPISATGAYRVYWFLLWAGVLWVVVGALNKITKGQFFRRVE
jgi:protein-S-isoprenylcysteine O-methyltransferase Ste14